MYQSDLEGDMQSALFLTQWLSHLFSPQLRLQKSYMHWDFTNHAMISFLKEMGSWRAVLLLYSTWQSKSDVFQHCLRTFILCLSTFCVSFNTCCAHSYCIPALCAYISTIFEHFLHAFLCVSFNACIPFIIFKRNGELESWRAEEPESWRAELFKFHHF